MSKTRNEAIAVSKVMGWEYREYHGRQIFYDVDGNDLYLDQIGTDTPSGNWISKLLQVRMVEDGWFIQIDVENRKTKKLKPNCNFTVHAGFGKDAEPYHFVVAETEPSAIVELFCKVYGIKEEA